MNNEIKEILDKLKNENNYQVDCNDGSAFKELFANEINLLLDYITNLQEKVEQYENPDDLTLFYMWLDEKAKDKMKKLQEENKELKAKLEMYENGVYFSSENDKLQEENERLNKGLEYAKRIEKDYKTKFDKAIEYLNDNCFLPTTTNEYIFSPKHLMNILKGDDKE